MCKVTYVITYPEYFIFLDEVGGNTNQKGDGQLGGDLMIYELGKTHEKR